MLRDTITCCGVQQRPRMVAFLAFSLACVVLSSVGCAGSPAASRALVELPEDVSLSSFTSLQVEVESRKALALDSSVESRISELIYAKFKERDSNWFEEVPAAEDDPDTLVLSVRITKYEAGDPVARALQGAGYGQAHINAIVTIRGKLQSDILAKYSVKKTFAWGGVYGASTTIEDIEHGFAEAIVDLVLGPTRGEDRRGIDA